MPVSGFRQEPYCWHIPATPTNRTAAFFLFYPANSFQNQKTGFKGSLGVA
jgi:hypothetical protein